MKGIKKETKKGRAGNDGGSLALCTIGHHSKNLPESRWLVGWYDGGGGGDDDDDDDDDDDRRRFV